MSALKTTRGMSLLILFFLRCLAVTDCLTSSGSKFTLYDKLATWNEARAICESDGLDMVKLDRQEKYNWFLEYHAQWMTNGQIMSDLWTGLHQNDTDFPTVSSFAWHDCSALGNFSHWGENEPDNLSLEKCVRYDEVSRSLKTRDCSQKLQVICEEAINCNFEEYKDKSLQNLSAAYDIIGSLQECLDTCLHYDDGVGQCVAVAYAVNKDNVCGIYSGIETYTLSTPPMKLTIGQDAYVKRCVIGEYKKDIPHFDRNSDLDPITVCPTETASSEVTSYVLTSSEFQVEETLMTSFSSHVSVIQSAVGVVSTYQFVSLEVSTPHHNNTDSVLTSSGSTTDNSDDGTTPFYTQSLNYLAISDSTISSVLTSTEYMIPSASVKYETTASSYIDHILTSGPVKYETTASTYTDYIVTSGPVKNETTASTYTNNIVPSASVKYETTALSYTDYIVSSASVKYETTASTFTVTSHHQGTQTTTVCQCFCANKSDVSFVISSLKLFINKKELSSYRRSKMSAEDNRVSAKVIGSSGIGIVLVFIMVILCLDLDRLSHVVRAKTVKDI